MKKTALFFAAFVAVNVLAQIPALEFKGVPLGITLEEAATKYKKLQGEIRVSTSGDGVAAIGVSDTVAGIIPKNILLLFTQNDISLRPTNYSGSIIDVSPGLRKKFDSCIFHVASVDFDASDYQTLRAALTEKYGAPTAKETNVLENRFGAKTKSETLTWTLANGTVKIDEYARTIETCRIQWKLTAPWPKKNTSDAIKDL